MFLNLHETSITVHTHPKFFTLLIPTVLQHYPRDGHTLLALGVASLKQDLMCASG
jgi:hypothetical protein